MIVHSEYANDHNPLLQLGFSTLATDIYWSWDIRYIEKHQLDGDKPVYVISILENYCSWIGITTYG